MITAADLTEHAKVSVIMPCFNHSRYLADSVGGIRNQTCRDVELIIIDDCSSDASWDIIEAMAKKDARIKTIRHTHNEGASKSRNDGLRIASGRFIAFCDADDIWESDKLQVQTKLLEENHGYDVAYCDAAIIDEQGQSIGSRFSDRFPLPKPPSGRLFRDLLVRNFINMQSVLMRKECLRRVGYFDEGIKWVEDWWYWVCLAHQHAFLYSDQSLARYRVHNRSTNLVQKRGGAVNRIKVFRRILRRYPDLPSSDKIRIVYNIAAQLCDLGKIRTGRRLLWNVVGLSITNMQASGSFCRALRRLVISRALSAKMQQHLQLRSNDLPV